MRSSSKSLSLAFWDRSLSALRALPLADAFSYSLISFSNCSSRSRSRSSSSFSTSAISARMSASSFGRSFWRLSSSTQVIRRAAK